MYKAQPLFGYQDACEAINDIIATMAEDTEDTQTEQNHCLLSTVFESAIDGDENAQAEFFQWAREVKDQILYEREKPVSFEFFEGFGELEKSRQMLEPIIKGIKLEKLTLEQAWGTPANYLMNGPAVGDV